MPVSTSVILKHYKQLEIQNALVGHALNKEIGLQYNGHFGKRPDILTYPRDVLELAKRGMSSLHASEELWSNPLSLSSSITKKEMTVLRIGWDLILDIDCKIFEYSRICADLVVKFLTHCGVIDISCKFSGNKGFHIGVPFEAFPKKVGEEFTKDLFPEAPKKIAIYVTAKIKDELARRILEFENNDFSVVKEKVEVPHDELIYSEKTEQGVINKLNVESFLEIDTILISPRHLYRMPYSLHEKSGLVSIPTDPFKVIEFEKSMAKPEVISLSSFQFLNREVMGESARQLLINALDFEIEEAREIAENTQYQEIKIENPIKNDFFPPCMDFILKGLEDGKKRAIFIVMNFLGKIGWSKPEIEQYLKDWNKKNQEPLREVYLKGQLSHFVPGAKLPPNCDNENYCLAIGACQPDAFCKRIKNPANYTLFRWKIHLRDNKDSEKKAKAKELKAKAKEMKDKAKEIKKKAKEKAKEKEIKVDNDNDNSNLEEKNIDINTNEIKNKENNANKSLDKENNNKRNTESNDSPETINLN
jgi:hypothetical protein